MFSNPFGIFCIYEVGSQFKSFPPNGEPIVNIILDEIIRNNHVLY